ncbi:MAG: tetratricopeptide repeat protein [Planctomycetes bacterium]|nr:tetratricopeptide repeat protein [Planctomycetota bacterium]MBZ0151766.1 tetratricopeptide repeat protein [Planctomycetota bacterium]MCC7395516.1 tetratricopeptide repeat protein [Planctomycetota bacterium]
MRTAFFVSFLLGAAALPAQDREFGVPVNTTLAHVRAEAEAYKNVKVVFTVQFASLGRISNPFFTKFTPTDFANFYAWGDEQPIWQEKGYDDVFGMLFLSKTHPKLEQLYQLRLYQRVKCTGVIRNTFQGLPWIEVTDFEPLAGQLDTAVLTHLYRGEKLMNQRLWQRAIAELSLAPGAGVPETATCAAHKNLGICLLRLGEAQAAIGYLESASRLAGGNDHEVEELLATARTQPATAIDRTVDAKSLRDAERPMWEAFDGSRKVGATTRDMR